MSISPNLVRIMIEQAEKRIEEKVKTVLETAVPAAIAAAGAGAPAAEDAAAAAEKPDLAELAEVITADVTRAVSETLAARLADARRETEELLKSAAPAVTLAMFEELRAETQWIKDIRQQVEDLWLRIAPEAVEAEAAAEPAAAETEAAPAEPAAAEAAPAEPAEPEAAPAEPEAAPAEAEEKK